MTGLGRRVDILAIKSWNRRNKAAREAYYHLEDQRQKYARILELQLKRAKKKNNKKDRHSCGYCGEQKHNIRTCEQRKQNELRKAADA